MAKSKSKTYPIYGEVKKNPIEIDYNAAYNELKLVYNDYMNTSVSQKTFEESLKKCEELIAANKSCAEQIASEKKSVELLQQQIQNKDVYITRLNNVIAQLNIQIFNV